MESLITVYLPVGVGTFHMETAADQFARSVRLLKSIDGDVVVPDKPLLSVEALRDFLAPLRPGLVIFQDLTFANGAYMAEVLRRYDGPVLLWTLREPAGDGGRLKLNSLTGAYSAAHTLRNFGNRPFSYVFGAPEEENVREAVQKAIRAAADECVTSLLDEKPEEREKTPEEVFAASIRDKMRSLKIAAVGHTPQGFGFGRALDAEMMHNFGAELVSVEVRELINKAKSYADEECAEYLARTEEATCGFGKTPEKNRLDHARLYKAYTDFVRENGIVIEDASDGYAKLRLNVAGRHLDAFGAVSRAVLFTLADFSAAPAAQFGREPEASVSFGVRIAFYSPCCAAVLTAEAKRIEKTEDLDRYEIEVRNEREEIAARAFVSAYCKY